MQGRMGQVPPGRSRRRLGKIDHADDLRQVVGTAATESLPTADTAKAPQEPQAQNLWGGNATNVSSLSPSSNLSTASTTSTEKGGRPTVVSGSGRRRQSRAEFEHAALTETSSGSSPWRGRAGAGATPGRSAISRRGVSASTPNIRVRAPSSSLTAGTAAVVVPEDETGTSPTTPASQTPTRAQMKTQMQGDKAATATAKSKSNKKAHCNVRFAADQSLKTTKTIECLVDVSQEQKDSVWYTTAELKRTMDEAKETTIAMQSGVPLSEEDEHFTTRGLEYMTPTGFDITTTSLDVVRMILAEQTRQKEEGLSDIELLATAAGSVSRHRLRIAHLAAMKDARGVYGDGQFKTTVPPRSAPKASGSFHGIFPGGGTTGGAEARREAREARRAALRSSGSFGSLNEQGRSRRRRGKGIPMRVQSTGAQSLAAARAVQSMQGVSGRPNSATITSNVNASFAPKRDSV